MTEPTPKRRGRPPGSRNKPTTKPPATLSRPPLPQPPNQAVMLSHPLGELVSTPGLSVRLRKSRLAFSDPKLPDTEVEWPAGWPLPTTGQVIISSSISGAVDRVEFDLDGRFISITLR